mgnify:FL=1
MRTSRTLKTQSLRLDLTVMALITVIIIGAAWLVYKGLQKQFIDNSVAGASNASVFIESELSHAQEQLALFANIEPAKRADLALPRFDTFSDLYALDDNGQIRTIYKAKPQSRLFEGYAFTAGPVWQELLRRSNVARVSSIVAGYEDGAPSVYVLYRGQDQSILGRLNLEYIQNFINQYSRITGNVLLLTTDHGVVMISGRPDLTLPRIDIATFKQNISATQTITLDQQQWVPVIEGSEALGAHLAVLVPTRMLDAQRHTMLTALAAVLAGLLLIVIMRHRSLDAKVLQPLNQLVQRIRKIEAGEKTKEHPEAYQGLPAELVEINKHIQAMSGAIAERESALASTAAALSTRETELSLILRYLPVPLVVFEPLGDRLITFTNESFLDALGYSTTEAHSITALFKHTCQDTDTATRVSQAIEQMIEFHRQQQKPATPIEISIQCRSGVRHDFMVSAILLQDTAIATLVDVTALRQSQRALLAAKITAERQEREQSKFLAMMSHEIRTPLTSIVGITQLLAQDELTTRQRDYVSRLENGNQLLLRIVNDVLDHSKIEAGELNLQTSRFDLYEMFEKCHGMFAKLAYDKGIELSFDIEPNCPAWRIADAFRLEQVLANLIGNAIKFTEQGHVRVKLTCSVKEPGRDPIKISVTDTGMGIPKDLESMIFEPYKQIEHGSVRQLGGTGLGLAISKKIIQAMGGEIGFTTKANEGTTFWIEVPLPVAEYANPALDPTSPATPKSQEHLHEARVLVVDDSKAIQFLITEMLSSMSIQCVSANDGLEALTFLRDRENHVDAVLMDIQMPTMGGIECTKAIREVPYLKALPVIAMTADLVGQKRQEIMNAGANALLEKPLRQERLLQCLAHHIEATDWRLFPRIDGIEREQAMQTIGQDAERFTRLLRIFLQENRGTAQTIQEALDGGEIDQVLAELHRLKAGASQIGALEVRDIAEQLGTLVREKASIDSTLVERITAELEKIEMASR